MMIKLVFKSFLVLALYTLAISCTQEPVIYLVGDSTMANKPVEDNPERGWGQLLPEFFNDEISIDNHAMNGRSSRSFIYEGRWDSVISMVNKGDYVVLQFGHNDGSKYKTERYCTPKEYRYNLTKFINEAKGKGARPILCTSIQRRKFDSIGVLIDTHGEYPVISRELAEKFNIPLIDMQARSNELIMRYGVEDSKKIFLHVKPGEYARFPEGKADNTHFSDMGARLMAGLFVEGLKDKQSELETYLKSYDNE